jgi:Rrf2 family protein
MLLNSAVQNCIVILNELKGKAEPVPAYKIVQKYGLSAAFVDQLCRKLRNAGYVHSYRGNGGGYSLTETGKQVTLLELIALLSKFQSDVNLDGAAHHINQVKNALAEIHV